MGRKLTNKRCISSDRKRIIRKQKNKILIAVEGKNKTEKIYFNNFDDGKKNYSISFAKGNYTDPLNLIKMLINEVKKIGMDLNDKDEAYCVFDTDINPSKNKIINEARKLAFDNGIKIISSVPSIELWFLLHYEYSTSCMNNKDVIDRLKNYYPKYDKNVNIYDDINDSVNVAIKRAKRLEKYHIDNKKKIGTTDANPSTEVYKIIENLLND